jgi:hypothetical protein
MRKSFRKTSKKHPKKQNRKSLRRNRKGGFSFFTKTPTTINEIDEKTKQEFNLTTEELESFNTMSEGDKIKFIKDKTCLVREPQINVFTGRPMPAGFTKVPNKSKCKKLCNVLKKIGGITDCGDDFEDSACATDIDSNENQTRNCNCNPEKCNA